LGWFSEIFLPFDLTIWSDEKIFLLTVGLNSSRPKHLTSLLPYFTALPFTSLTNNTLKAQTTHTEMCSNFVIMEGDS
jgi:hypothetical protein